MKLEALIMMVCIWKNSVHFVVVFAMVQRTVSMASLQVQMLLVTHVCASELRRNTRNVKDKINGLPKYNSACLIYLFTIFSYKKALPFGKAFKIRFLKFD